MLSELKNFRKYKTGISTRTTRVSEAKRYSITTAFGLCFTVHASVGLLCAIKPSYRERQGSRQLIELNISN